MVVTKVWQKDATKQGCVHLIIYTMTIIRRHIATWIKTVAFDNVIEVKEKPKQTWSRYCQEMVILSTSISI